MDARLPRGGWGVLADLAFALSCGGRGSGFRVERGERGVNEGRRAEENWFQGMD